MRLPLRKSARALTGRTPLSEADSLPPGPRAKIFLPQRKNEFQGHPLPWLNFPPLCHRNVFPCPMPPALPEVKSGLWAKVTFSNLSLTVLFRHRRGQSQRIAPAPFF